MKEDDLQKQAWEYFKLHANQRLITFNFYLVISSVISTGLFEILSGERYQGILSLFSLFLFLFSFIFWKLDQRNKFLIKGAEDTLKYFEAQIRLVERDREPHIAKRFLREEHDTNQLKKTETWKIWNNQLSYSDCFNIVFMTFGLLGFALFIYSMIRHIM